MHYEQVHTSNLDNIPLISISDQYIIACVLYSILLLLSYYYCFNSIILSIYTQLKFSHTDVTCSDGDGGCRLVILMRYDQWWSM